MSSRSKVGALGVNFNPKPKHSHHHDDSCDFCTDVRTLKIVNTPLIEK